MILPMTRVFAAQISGWTYENEYAVYSFSQEPATVLELMNGDYYAYLDAEGALAGFFCFGGSAKIPAAEPDAMLPKRWISAWAWSRACAGKGAAPHLCKPGWITPNPLSPPNASG